MGNCFIASKVLKRYFNVISEVFVNSGDRGTGTRNYTGTKDYEKIMVDKGQGNGNNQYAAILYKVGDSGIGSESGRYGRTATGSAEKTVTLNSNGQSDGYNYGYQIGGYMRERIS